MIKRKRYEAIRFFLFANSYSGKTISCYIQDKYKNKGLLRVIKRLSVVLNFNYKQLQQFTISNLLPPYPYKRTPLRLKVYLEIENELSKLTEEKLDEYSTAMEDYQRQLLAPAIERAAGNLMENMDDIEFEKTIELQIRKYTYIYYKIAYKYKLPTLRIVPFLLRLISS